MKIGHLDATCIDLAIRVFHHGVDRNPVDTPVPNLATGLIPESTISDCREPHPFYITTRCNAMEVFGPSEVVHIMPGIHTTPCAAPG